MQLLHADGAQANKFSIRWTQAILLTDQLAVISLQAARVITGWATSGFALHLVHQVVHIGPAKGRDTVKLRRKPRADTRQRQERSFDFRNRRLENLKHGDKLFICRISGKIARSVVSVRLSARFHSIGLRPNLTLIFCLVYRL